MAAPAPRTAQHPLSAQRELLEMGRPSSVLPVMAKVHVLQTACQNIHLFQIVLVRRVESLLEIKCFQRLLGMESTFVGRRSYWS